MPGDIMAIDGYDVYAPPHKKKNIYTQEAQKFDQIVYFFDYIDDVFQKKISKLFMDLLAEAKTIQEEDGFDDPYTPEKLLYHWSNGRAGRDPIKSESNFTKVEPEALKQYNPEFDVELWKNSFSAAKISNIIKTFGWKSKTSEPFYFKRLIDKFDFDGNGRLDAREFLFYAIWENFKTYRSCKKHCFKELIEQTLTPLFTYFDCDDDGYINSENLFEGLKFLKRTKPEAYSLYKCEVPHIVNKFYRTHATNDFVLKNFNIAEGYLNDEEFRKGILLGYWERQSNTLNVVDNDSINKKDERWDKEGMKDKDCEELLMMYRYHK
jgi:Ca2+-binding EF-hand superfamily protein